MGDWDLYFLAGVESHASAGSEDRRGQQRDESNTRYRDRHISSVRWGRARTVLGLFTGPLWRGVQAFKTPAELSAVTTR